MPPWGNTGAVTRGQLFHSEVSGAACAASALIVDWLAFTVPVTAAERDAIVDKWGQLFGGVKPGRAGGLGYDRSAEILGSGRLYWSSSRIDMGLHVDLPSSALAVCPLSVSELLDTVIAQGGRFTRVDVAMDSSSVHINEVIEAIRAGTIVSRAQDIYLMQSMTSAPGATVYIGSRGSGKGRRKSGSRRLTRFYDKAAEQSVEGIWTRCEVQHRAEYAQAVALYLAEGKCDPVDIICSAVDFRDVDNANKSRRSRSRWWSEWIGDLAQRVSFARELPQRTVREVAQWFVRQCAPALAMLSRCDDQWREWLAAVIEERGLILDEYRLTMARRFSWSGASLSVVAPVGVSYGAA